MLIPQAIVSSPESMALTRNELVARSPELDNNTLNQLLEWSPGRNDLAYGQTESINFCRFADDVFAVSRTFMGQIQNRADGCRRLVTHFVILGQKEMAAYWDNAALLAHTLRSQGEMSLHSTSEKALPMLEIPAEPFRSLCEMEKQKQAHAAERIVHAMAIHENIVFVGFNRPLAFLCGILANLPEDKRRDTSFSTGLRVDAERSFTFRFFSEDEPTLIKDLAGLQLRTIAAESLQMLPSEA